MAAKRVKHSELTEWSKRLLGVVLCAFFGLGVLVGARMGVQRTSDWLGEAMQRLRRSAVAAIDHESGPPAGSYAATPIALVRRGLKFYALSADGALRDVAASASEADLPILSGAQVDQASGSELVEYAALVVRAEAALSQTVSELKVAPDGTVKLFLASSPTEVILEPGRAATELARAGWVMRRWRGREKLIAALDATLAGAAAIRLAVSPRSSSSRHEHSDPTGARSNDSASHRPGALGRTARR